MNKQEISKILLIAMGIDNRLNVSDQNQLITKVEGWYLALSKSMTFEFAKDAIGRHYSTSTDVLMPANLNNFWKVELDKNASISTKNSIESQKKNTGMPDTVRQMLKEMGLRQ